ncbi:HAD family hydrolase [Stappia sp.]|uniref:HAD family hydrolase n=1 Tax=Stappia sp. TaxID=1870903 RepID=UPI003A98E79B
MATIEAVLFDKDGTLIDFQGTWAPTFHVLMSELSRGDTAIAERLAEAAGFDLPARRFAPDSVLVAGSNDDIVDAFAEILGLPDPQALADDINARIGDMSLPYLSPFDDLIPMLDRLAVHGLPLGVATNDSEASARAQLAAMGISDRFSAIIGFDSGHGAKPAPGMVTGFCKALALDPASVVMVGDSVHDMHAGRAAGARTLAVTTGTVGAEILAPHADHVAASLSEALAWIEAERAG